AIVTEHQFGGRRRDDVAHQAADDLLPGQPGRGKARAADGKKSKLVVGLDRNVEHDSGNVLVNCREFLIARSQGHAITPYLHGERIAAPSLRLDSAIASRSRA